MKGIRICSNHPEYQTPLIWTFAFNGSEYWCPFCGYNHGMFGAGEEVDTSEELQNRLEKFKKFSSEFLHAKGVQVCSAVEWEGKDIDPQDLPQHEKDRLEKILNEWRYGVDIEKYEFTKIV